MEQLIASIQKTLDDYREDENNPSVRVTEDCITTWINQFNQADRIPILTELDNIFKKRYCSKNGVKLFLQKVINTLTRDFNFSTPQDLLKNSNFLNLQPKGKSQGIMLHLFNELIEEKYNLTLAECGTDSKKYSIYIDDILCTGLTLISDIKDWSQESFNEEKNNQEAVADNSTILVFAYVFNHMKNYNKKVAEMKYKISKEISSKHKMYFLHKIDNNIEATSKIDLVHPLQNGHSNLVYDYEKEIFAEVDVYTNSKGYQKESVSEFYRPNNLPTIEDFFTNASNRTVLENAFLEKGVQIINSSNAQNRNMRALGYSIPSLKNFGFGALCFTWRNVPNNAPLVFWYLGGGFIPLFKVTRGV